MLVLCYGINVLLISDPRTRIYLSIYLSVYLSTMGLRRVGLSPACGSTHVRSGGCRENEPMTLLPRGARRSFHG